MARKVLLVCGILSVLFYAAMDVIGGTRWQSYNWMSQEFSRLSAIGAPSRPLHLVLNPIYSLLVIAFGLGIWRWAGRRLARAEPAVGAPRPGSAGAPRTMASACAPSSRPAVCSG